MGLHSFRCILQAHALPNTIDYIHRDKQVDQILQTIDDGESIVAVISKHPDMVNSSLATHMISRFCMNLCNAQCAIIRRCGMAHSAGLRQLVRVKAKTTMEGYTNSTVARKVSPRSSGEKIEYDATLCWSSSIFRIYVDYLESVCKELQEDNGRSSVSKDQTELSSHQIYVVEQHMEMITLLIYGCDNTARLAGHPDPREDALIKAMIRVQGDLQSSLSHHRELH